MISLVCFFVYIYIYKIIIFVEDVCIMLLGSHHSMSYLEPANKWNKLWHFLRQTQNVDIETQYLKYSVRVFDIRLYIDNHLHVMFKQECVPLRTVSVYDVLSFLNRMGDCYVRVSLEVNDSDFMTNMVLAKYKRFSEYCAIIEDIYPHITFLGGIVSQTGQWLYRFTKNKNNLIEVKMNYHSNNSLKNFLVNAFRKICPRLFFFFFNKQFYDRLLSDSSIKTFFLMDFVDTRD